MRCPRCKAENPETKKFCRKCGANLTRACPHCNSEYFLADEFCGECGFQLISPQEISPIDYTKPQSYTPKYLAEKILSTRGTIEGERKLVTVLFADMAGYVSLSEKLDPEEVQQIMDGLLRILMDEIHRFEGTINQFIGDGVMALFGAPLAHEEHAQNACYAALAIQKNLAEYSEKVKKDCGQEILMRIGLNSGPVVVGSIGDDLRMDYTAIGDTINLASRMERMAKPGSIFITENTYKTVKNFFKFESLGKHPVKGKEELQEVYELLKSSEVKTKIEAAMVSGLTKFVGRKKEMESLQDILEKARSGFGQVVGIVGEAGVGKSRLILEMRNVFPKEEYLYLEGRCLHYGGSKAFLPLLDILRSYFEIEEGDPTYLINRKMREKIHTLDEKLNILPSFQELLSLKVEEEAFLKLEPRQKRERIFESLRDLFIRESQNKPLVLVIEDLHWIDKTSEEFLDYLIGWLANTPILLILLYRPEYTQRWASKSYYNNLGLDQLTIPASAELVQSILGEGKIVPEIRALILGKASGNPLFMEELTHTLLENGSIKRTGNQYVLSQKGLNLQVPDSIQGIIAARIDRLEESLKRIMQVASVIGREFAFRILQAILEMEEGLKSHLVNLQGLEFIYEKRLFPELEYIFKHALTQEVAYNSLLLKRRKEIHEKTGKAIETLYPDRLEEFYEMLAYHFSYSPDPADLKKSVNYGEKAAARAISVYAYGEAVRLFDQTLKVQGILDPDNKGKRCDLLLDLCDALLLAVEFRRILDKEAPEAFSLAETVGDGSRASRACQVALSTILSEQSIYGYATPQAAEWAERANRYAKPDTKERAVADVALGFTQFTLGQKREGFKLLTQAFDLAWKLGDLNTVWLAGGSLLHYRTAPQHAQENVLLAEVLMKGSRVGVSPVMAGQVLELAGHAFLTLGMRQRAEEAWDEFRAIAKRIGVFTVWLGSTSMDTLLLLMDGRLEEVMDRVQLIRTRGEETGVPLLANNQAGLFGFRARFCLGRPLEALELALRDASRGDDILVLKPVHCLVLALLGRKEEASEILERLVVNRPGLGTAEDETFNYVDSLFLEAAVLTGHRQAAELILNRFTGTGICTSGIYNTTCIPRHMAGAAALLGRFVEARKHFQEALKICTGMNLRPELALTRLQLAELLFEHYPRERGEALEHLDFAIAEFEEMKMQPSLERALRQKERLKTQA
jgi:class 3 adenylate cyclase/tetratricopeptide (TPR) repeat protein